MKKILTVYPEKCRNCGNCELACSFVKTGEFNPLESAVSVLLYEKVNIAVPVMCMQCEDPACAKVCPAGAISRDPNGAVVSDPCKCVVCKLCVSACPLGNISYSPAHRTIVKCDLCGGSPYCAKVCPTGAIQYKETDRTVITKKRAVAEKFKELFEEVKK